MQNQNHRVAVYDIVRFIVENRAHFNVWTNNTPGEIALSIDAAIKESGIHVALSSSGEVTGVCLGKVDPDKIIVSQLLCKNKEALRQILIGGLRVHGLGKKKLYALRKGKIIEYKNLRKALKILWADQTLQTNS